MIPTLYTPRLALRPFSLADAARVQELAGDPRVAATTLRVPHPYPDGAAEEWIAAHAGAAEKGRSFNFAVTLAGTRSPGREHDMTDTGHIIGTVGLVQSGRPEDARAELGYWIGVAYWNRGFATEAAHAVLAFGFLRRNLHRITAWHLVENPASGRVLQKLGMSPEGTLRSQIFKMNRFQDVAIAGILRDEWIARRKIQKLRPAGRALQTV
ncbi:MAG TPA: GNAT family N-acetyltransferase [Phycisphaerae bacterium]